MQIPILSGIYADASPDWRTAYPVNLEPVPKTTGVSEGHLRMSEGITQFASGTGTDRGGINWRNECYRVMGTKFVKVAADGTVTEIGSVTPGGRVSMSYGFDYLGIASGGDLYLYDGTTLTKNTDTDLGQVQNVQWIDGYFIASDSENLVSTELGDPFSVRAFSYGSSEVDPDPVQAVLRLGSEIYAINRHTIEAFTNVGGSGFPFRVIDGTQIYRGAAGTHAACVFMKGIAFVGSGRNEEPGIYLYTGGTDVKISTRDVDKELAALSEDTLSDVICETRVTGNREVLYVHLESKTWCYDGRSTAAVQQPVWYSLNSNGAYRARNFVWCYGKWLVGDVNSSNVGEMSESTSNHWGDVVAWEFITPVLYNEGNGAIVHRVEMSGPVSATDGTEEVRLDYSEDGQNWTQPRAVKVSQAKPISFTRLGRMKNQRMFRFRGDSNVRIAPSRVQATLEPLAW